MGIKERIANWFNRSIERRVAITWSNFPSGLNSSIAATHKYYDYCKEGFGMNPIVYACIDEIGRATKAVKIVVKKGDDVLTEADRNKQNEPLFKFISRPNPYMALPEFLYRWAIYMELAGVSYVRGYGIGTRPGFNGETVAKSAAELRLLRPDTVAINPTNEGTIDSFTVTNAKGVKEVVPPEEIFYTSYADPLREFGALSPIRAAAATIDSHNAAILWNRNVLQNGGVPLMAIIIKGLLNVTSKERAAVQDAYRDQYAGAKNAGKPMVVPGDGVDVKTLAQSAKDLDWLQGKQDMMRDICACLGVPSELVGDPAASTYNNVSEARKSFYNEKVLPNLRQYVGEFSNWATLRYNLPEYSYDLDYSRIEALREDENQKVERLVRRTWWSDNEKREADGKEEVDGGDVILKPFNLAPITEIGQDFTKDLGGKDDGKDDNDDTDDNSSRVSYGRYSDDDALPYLDKRTRFATEADRRSAYQKFDKLRVLWERKYKVATGKFIAGQLKLVAGKMNQYRSAADDKREIRVIPTNFVEELFVDTDQNRVMAEYAKPLQVGLMIDFGQEWIDELLADGTLFEIERPDIQRWIAENLADRSRLINDTTAGQMQRIINQGVSQGESVMDIKQSLLDRYPSLIPGRARVIAQTETGRAASRASLESFSQMQVEEKEWLSARDDTVRDDPENSHVFMDGQVKKLNEPFEGPAGQLAEGPGLSGDPGFDCNCRCVVVPIGEGESPI